MDRATFLKITDKILKDGYPWKHELNMLCDHDADQRAALAKKDEEIQQIREHEYQRGLHDGDAGAKPLTWTTDPPTEPGWYWWRYKEGSRIYPIEVRDNFFYEIKRGEWWPERIKEPGT